MIRILVADDHALVRGGFRLILEAQTDMTVVGEARTAIEAVEQAISLVPDVILMDVGCLRWTASPRPGARPRSLHERRADPDDLRPRRIRLRRDEGRREWLPAEGRGPAGDPVHAVRVVARGDSLLAPSVTRRLIERFVRRPTAPPEARRPHAA